MIITCTACKTQYAVPDTAIGPQGKKVKCVKCGNIWLQTPLQQVVEPEKLKDLQKPPAKVAEIPKGSNLPAKRVKKKEAPLVFLLLKFGTFALLALFAFVIAFHEKFPQFSAIYRMIGLEKTDGLVFQNFTVEKANENNALKFSMQGDIVNESLESRVVRNINATVYSKGGTKMAKIILEIPHTVLEPNEKLHITPVIENVSANADRVTLDLGNRWELWFR